jgi:hypothetical protein
MNKTPKAVTDERTVARDNICKDCGEQFTSEHYENGCPVTDADKAPCVLAKIEWPIVRDENGKIYSFLGSGERYGLKSTYAVAEQGVVRRRILEAESLPWPYGDNEVRIIL